MFTLRFERNNEKGDLQTIVVAAAMYNVDRFKASSDIMIAVYQGQTLANGVDYRLSSDHTDAFTHFTAINMGGVVVERIAPQVYVPSQEVSPAQNSGGAEELEPNNFTDEEGLN